MQTKSQSQTRPEPTYSKGTDYSKIVERTDRMQSDVDKATKVLNEINAYTLKRTAKQKQTDVISQRVLAIVMTFYTLGLSYVSYQIGMYVLSGSAFCGFILYAISHAYMYRQSIKA